MPVEVKGVKIFGKEKNHLELSFENSRGRAVKAIGFFMKPDTFGQELKAVDKINLLVLLFQVLEIKTVVKGVKLQTGLCQSMHLLV